jgi:hypothetical protein
VPALHNTSTLETLNAIGAAELIAEGDVELLRQAWLTATRARNALVLVRGKPTDQLPGPGRQLNAVAVAAGWDSDDGGEFLDNYLRVTRRAKAVVRKVFGWLSIDFSIRGRFLQRSMTGCKACMRRSPMRCVALIRAGIHSRADEATIRKSASLWIEAAWTKLGGRAVTARRSSCGGSPSRGVGKSVTGFATRFAAARHTTRIRWLWWSEFRLGGHTGTAGWVHGGLLRGARPLLGEAASDGLTKPLFTGTITLRYLRARLGEAAAEAAIERTDGHKTFVSGSHVRRRGQNG